MREKEGKKVNRFGTVFIRTRPVVQHQGVKHHNENNVGYESAATAAVSHSVSQRSYLGIDWIKGKQTDI